MDTTGLLRILPYREPAGVIFAELTDCNTRAEARFGKVQTPFSQDDVEYACTQAVKAFFALRGLPSSPVSSLVCVNCPSAIAGGRTDRARNTARRRCWTFCMIADVSILRWRF